MHVHDQLGPGLLESVYEKCHSHELSEAGIPHERQVDLPIHHNGVNIGSGGKADMIVANRLVLELKPVEQIAPIHEAQLLTYLRLSNCRVGLLLNFNTVAVKDGIRRKVR